MAETLGIFTFRGVETKDIFDLRDDAGNLVNRAAGVYTYEILAEGSSLLSTLYVKSMDPGSQLIVRFWDNTTGDKDGERNEVIAHREVTGLSDFSERIIVSQIHKRVFCEATITGGSVQFGVRNTLLGYNANDIDAALQLQDSDYLSDNHKGIPIAGVNDSNQWQFAQFTDAGELKIAGIINADVVNAANDGKITIVNINANSWTPLPSVARSGRVSISIQNLSGFPIALNYDTPAGFIGKIYEDGTEIVRDIKDDLIIYAKASPDITTATVELIVEELGSV